MRDLSEDEILNVAGAMNTSGMRMSTNIVDCRSGTYCSSGNGFWDSVGESYNQYGASGVYNYLMS